VSAPSDSGNAAPRDLEISPAELRRLAALTVERLAAHLESLPRQPSADVDGAAELARSLREALPEAGVPYERLLELLFDRVVPKSFNTAGPGYLAYIPGGGLVQAGLADLISDVTNRFVGVWMAAPGLVQLEANVGRWLCDMVGYPPAALGLLTTGGSMANLIALVTARRERLPESFLSGVLYVSDQAHHSVQKAALIAGFPPANVRAVPTDERYCIRTEAIAPLVAADRAAGLTPFLLVANAGTTNTGAVDDLQACADVARDHGLWLHVDGAYGGFFVLTERGQRTLAGLERADSITLDPHKGLFLPYGTGSLLVRDGKALGRAHSVHAAYLPAVPEDPDFVDFSSVSPELSRDFRGLRVWLPLKLFGIEPFREQLDEKLDLIDYVLTELRKIEGIEIVAEPQLTILAFRLVRPGLTPSALNELNRVLLERINSRKRVMLTPAILDGIFVIRIAISSHRTHRDRVDMALDDIRAAIDDV